MKAILEFDLNDADERMNHLRCVKAFDMALALFNIIYNEKRLVERNVEDEVLTTCNEVIDYIFARIADEMDNRGIVIDDLIS